MKSFAITEAHLARLACALTGDELARNFNHYTDFLTRAEWSAATILGDDGLELGDAQIKACAARLCRFFDKSPDALKPQQSDTFGDWAVRLHPWISQSLTSFRFLPATQAAAAETRHATDEIWQDARVIASLMHGRRRVITMVSAHSLLGFVTSVLAPTLQQLDVLDGGAMAPDELVEALAFGDLLIATPTLWRYLAQTLPSFANNVMGISFGEQLPLDLASDLREMGLGAMRELYGSTETGIIGWRDTPSEPFVLFDHWHHENGALVRLCPNGQDRQLAAMDHLTWSGERAFSLAGRRDGAVQIGAINVFPKKIGEIIAAQPKIESCTVRVAERSGTLDRLVAHIVLKCGNQPDQDMAWQIDQWCQKKLRPQERPRIYVFDTIANDNL